MKTFYKMTNKIHASNYEMIKDNIDSELALYFSNDIFNYYVEEVGLETISFFIDLQEQKSYQLEMGLTDEEFLEYLDMDEEIKADKEEEEDSDSKEQNLFKRIMSIKHKAYNTLLLSEKLQRHFLKELIDNIPKDKLFSGREEIFNFVKVIEQQFLYEILIPETTKWRKRFN